MWTWSHIKHLELCPAPSNHSSCIHHLWNEEDGLCTLGQREDAHRSRATLQRKSSLSIGCWDVLNSPVLLLTYPDSEGLRPRNRRKGEKSMGARWPGWACRACDGTGTQTTKSQGWGMLAAEALEDSEGDERSKWSTSRKKGTSPDRLLTILHWVAEQKSTCCQGRSVSAEGLVYLTRT